LSFGEGNAHREQSHIYRPLKVLMGTADYFKDLEKLGNPEKDEAFAC
jgi:hypothetical protein